MIVAAAVAVHRIVAGPWDQNCYVVSTEGGDAVVVDPGGQAERIAEHIGTSRLRVHAVLATHGHHDHVGALAEVVETHDVPFAIHSGESETLRRVNLYRFAFHRLGPIELPPVGLDLATTTALRFGDLEIAVVHTPGHTPGSVCFEAGGVLFMGDALMAKRAGKRDMPGSDPARLEASVRRLTRTYPSDTVIYPGHGEPSSLGEAVAGIPGLSGPHR